MTAIYDSMATAYRKINSRCNNPEHPAYKNYGARGIRNLFNSSKELAQALGPKPSEGHWSIDRIDNDSDYSPKNVRRADWETQNNNKRTNHRVEYKGEIKTLADWARDLNLNYKIICGRIIGLGWSAERAFTQEVELKNQTITYKEKTRTLGEWADYLGLPYGALADRLNKPNWTIEKAFTTGIKETAKRNALYEYMGKRKTLSQWSTALGD